MTHDHQRSKYVCAPNGLSYTRDALDEEMLTHVQMRIRFVNRQGIARDAVCGNVARSEIVVRDDIVLFRETLVGGEWNSYHHSLWLRNVWTYRPLVVIDRFVVPFVLPSVGPFEFPGERAAHNKKVMREPGGHVSEETRNTHPPKRAVLRT